MAKFPLLARQVWLLTVKFNNLIYQNKVLFFFFLWLPAINVLIFGDKKIILGDFCDLFSSFTDNYMMSDYKSLTIIF